VLSKKSTALSTQKNSPLDNRVGFFFINSSLSIWKHHGTIAFSVYGDILPRDGGVTVPYIRTRHYGGSNLAQYRYVKKKYAKKTRAEVFWSTTGLVFLLVGGLVALQFSETDAEKKARIKKQQEEYLVVVCKLGKAACDNAKAAIRTQNCYFHGEDCTQ
jgi:hypothetical protein